MKLVSASKTETNTYTIELTISAEDFKEAIRKAYLKQRNSISVPGFRKGKAPLNMIERIYGKEVFYEDALELLYPEAVEAAYAEAKIDAVDSPYDVDIKTISAEQGVELSFKVTVKPEITVKAYKGLAAEKGDAKVTKAEIQEEIDRMLERSARIIDVDDRKVKNGDIAVIDFEGFVDGVAFEGGKGEAYELTIGSGSFIPGFEEQVIGHGIDEEFDVNVKFPEDYAAELAGKDAIFKIKLHAIKVKELPELDDEFAKDLGEYDTVAELKKGIEEDIAKRKQDSADKAFEDAILEELCANVEGEIPDCMYESKAKENIESFSSRIAQQGIELDMYLMYMGMDREAFEAQMREQAVTQVKLDLAIEKIAALEGITASDDEVEAEYTKMSEMYKLDVEKIKSIVSAATVSGEIARQAAYKFVIDNATVKKAPAKKAAAKSDAPADEKAEKKAPAKKPAAKKTAEAKTDAPAKKPAAKKTTKKETPAE